MSVIDTIREKLRKYPDVTYDATENSITIPAQTPDGFSVSLYRTNDGYTVHFEGWHEEFKDESEALNCFAFGLSDECRLRVIRRGKKDYKWFLQHKVNGEWRDESEVGLLIFSFWRKRQERVLQNHLIKSL